MTDPGPLPHAWTKHACVDLVNSRWMDHLGSGRSFDRLPFLQWRRAFLARYGQIPRGTADAPEIVAGLHALRVLLRPLLEAFARGEALASADIDELNDVLAASPLVRRLETVGGEYRLVEAPASRERRWALAEVAASAAELLAEG